jgi:chromosome segregation ATPase
MTELDKSAKKLSANQAHLDHQVRRLEKQMKTVLSHHRAGGRGNHDAGAGEVAARELQTRVSALEQASRTAAKRVFNMTRQLVGMDKLHQSMLQLLESVETLENKVDSTVPDLQREISKMEFNMAQLTSSIALIKEDQVGVTNASNTIRPSPQNCLPIRNSTRLLLSFDPDNEPTDVTHALLSYTQFVFQLIEGHFLNFMGHTPSNGIMAL